MTFGIIIHYGLYSYYGYDDIQSAKKRRVQNGSEWYYGRLIDDNDFRPISGQSFTKKYHKENFGNIDYFHNINKIVNDEDKIRSWVLFAKENKASYIILTLKHHDGVCLWNTKTDSRKSELDICKVFSDECKKENIDFGFYYSWFEFGKPFTVEYFKKYCIPQLSEILTYNPKYLWFDGDWKITQKSIIKEIKNMIIDMKQKGIIINDRIGVKDNDYSLCDYRVFSDRYIPKEKLDTKWQHVNTIGYSWGYNKQQSNKDYKTGEQIYVLYKKVKDLGGDFLINIGPDENGDIIENEMKAIEYLESKVNLYP
jgi:alpha-L-fucosidase